MNDQEYYYISRMVLKLLNIDLNIYQSNQMRRRLDSFIENSKVSNIAMYCHKVERDPVMLKQLNDFLTINVSEFFRDDLQFTNLKKVVMPELLQNSHTLNIWSAGCSNGAEIYSIAMILNEISSLSWHKLSATDIDDKILARAKQGGPYNQRESRNIEKWDMQKHFTISEKSHWVTDDIKQNVQFRKQNLMNDLFEKGFDLIVCRYVMIYFSDDARTELFRKFHQSLNSEGVLFIGGSEMIIGASNLGFTNFLPSMYKKSDPTHSPQRIACDMS